MRIGILMIFAVSTCRKSRNNTINVAAVIKNGDEYVKKIEELFNNNPMFQNQRGE
jgi:hypothetical protein